MQQIPTICSEPVANEQPTTVAVSNPLAPSSIANIALDCVDSGDLRAGLIAGGFGLLALGLAALANTSSSSTAGGEGGGDRQ
jgi:hypothetical protein